MEDYAEGETFLFSGFIFPQGLLGNKGASALLGGEQTFLNQLANSLAHRLPTDAKISAQFLLWGNRIPGGKPLLGDQFSYLLSDLEILWFRFYLCRINSLVLLPSAAIREAIYL